MLLREFLEFGTACKVCGSILPKSIGVKTSWTERLRVVEFKDNNLIFKFEFVDCYVLFKFNVDTHNAECEIYNPKNYDMMYNNNFIFKIECKDCNSYSFESSMITFHPMGSLTTDVDIFAEEITVKDELSLFRVRNLIHSDKLTIFYSLCDNNDGTMELPFMTLQDFPIKNKMKMLKKIRTILLLTG
jgi:hypothetical protein